MQAANNWKGKSTTSRTLLAAAAGLPGSASVRTSLYSLYVTLAHVSSGARQRHRQLAGQSGAAEGTVRLAGQGRHWYLPGATPHTASASASRGPGQVQHDCGCKPKTECFAKNSARLTRFAKERARSSHCRKLRVLTSRKASCKRGVGVCWPDYT